MSTRYKTRQKLISIGDDFWIENQEGAKVFKVDGKVLRIRKTLVFEDAKGKKLAQIQERLLTIRDTMVIDGPDGKEMAVIKKALIAPLRDRWTVKVKGGADLDARSGLSGILPRNDLASTPDVRARSSGPTVVVEIDFNHF